MASAECLIYKLAQSPVFIFQLAPGSPGDEKEFVDYFHLAFVGKILSLSFLHAAAWRITQNIDQLFSDASRQISCERLQ